MWWLDYINLIETIHLAFADYFPPRSRWEVIRAWGCIAFVAVSPSPSKQACQVPQTSLICTSTQLSPCSEHLGRCGSSAVVLGSGCSRLGLRVRLWAVHAFPGWREGLLGFLPFCVHVCAHARPVVAAAISSMLLRTPLQEGSATGADNYDMQSSEKPKEPGSRSFRLFVLEGEEAISDLSKFILP